MFNTKVKLKVKTCTVKFNSVKKNKENKEK